MEILSAITESATQHITWALTLLGGTLLTIVGTSHVSPPTRKGRFIYFLFAPAWGCLAASIYFGDRIQRHAISILIVNEEKARSIHAEINADFINQINSLAWAGGFLVIWLVFYLFWWVCFRQDAEEKVK